MANKFGFEVYFLLFFSEIGDCAVGEVRILTTAHILYFYMQILFYIAFEYAL